MTGTQALIKLVTVFDSVGIPYMIVGSYSSNFYGIPRMTKDADLVLHLDPEGWKKLPTLLPDGISIESQIGFEMITATQRELLKVDQSLFQIELFRLSQDAFDQSRFDRRVHKTIAPGIKVYLPTAEDVIVQKLRWCLGANRQKDYSDCVAVMQIQGSSLQWQYIEYWCAQHNTWDLLTKAKNEASVIWSTNDDKHVPNPLD